MKKTWQKLFIMFLVFMMCVSVVAVFSFTPSNAQAAGGMVWDATQRTTSAFNKTNPDIDRSGTTTYYVWQENDGSREQLWYGWLDEDNIFSSKQLTSVSAGSGIYGCYLDVEGSKAYLAWSQHDGTYYQIYTGEVDLDGTNFSAAAKTSTNTYKYIGGIEVVGTKIYYTYTDQGTSRQIYTAEMNTDGTGWSATQRTSSDENISPSFEIYNNKFYITFGKYESGGIQKQMLATMNTDGTGWSAVSLGSYTGSIGFLSAQLPDIDVYNGDIAIVFFPQDNDVPGKQLYLGIVNDSLDGWDYLLEVRGAGYGEVGDVYADVEMDGSQTYLAWSQHDESGNPQIYTGQLDLDDWEWRPTQRTDAPDESVDPRFLIDGDDIYHIFVESDGSNNQIWTSVESDTSVATESTYVSASVPTTLTFTATPVTSGTPCPNSGGSADFGTTGSSVNFGNYTGGEDKLGCQEISVTTNATDGYITTMQINQALTNSTADEMDNFSGSSGTADTWVTPEVWTSPVAPNDSYFGWTTDDTTDYIKFAASKYAAFVANQTPYEVATESGPVVAETNYITFRLEVGVDQEAGLYEASVMYITTATY